MPDEQEYRVEIDPAAGNATGRMVARLTTLTQRRPDEPRDFAGAFPGWLTWIPPQIPNFTHYYLRVGHDDGNPDYELPPDQTAIQIFKGNDFFLSTFNQPNGRESGPVRLQYDTDLDLRTYIQDSLEEDEMVANYEMTSSPFPIPLAPAPQPGLRLVIFLAQDATGGRVPTWDASFKNAPTTAIDPGASTLSTIDFVYRRVTGIPSGDDAWYCVGYQTGLSDL